LVCLGIGIAGPVGKRTAGHQTHQVVEAVPARLPGELQEVALQERTQGVAGLLLRGVPHRRRAGPVEVGREDREHLPPGGQVRLLADKLGRAQPEDRLHVEIVLLEEFQPLSLAGEASPARTRWRMAPNWLGSDIAGRLVG